MPAVDMLASSLVVGCATAAAVACWRSGSIFASWRDWLELQQHLLLQATLTQPEQRLYWYQQPAIFLLELLECPFCLTFWVAAGLTLTLQPLPSEFLCRWLAATAVGLLVVFKVLLRIQHEQ